MCVVLKDNFQEYIPLHAIWDIMLLCNTDTILQLYGIQKYPTVQGSPHKAKQWHYPLFTPLESFIKIRHEAKTQHRELPTPT